MKSTKHIVWLCPGFAADEDDDSCIPPLQLFLAELQNKFPEYKISIIAFQYPFKTGSYRIGNSLVFPMNGRNRKGVGRLFTWIKVWNRFKEINKEGPVDLIHSFWFSECMLAGKFLSSRFKIAHINTLMGQDVLPSNRYLKKYFLERVKTIALCERHAAVFKQNTGYDPVAVIPWGIDGSDIIVNANKEYDMIGVGSLITLKRYDLFMNVVSELKKTFPGIKVLLVGDGPERTNLEKQSELLNLSGNITFTGRQSRSSVMNLMNKSKIFVHTSGYESFGFVFLEAMKYGLPVVSFPVGLARGDDNWIVVNSEKEMIDGIIVLLNNGHSAQSMIPFSIHNIALQYDKLYNNIGYF